MSRTEDNELFRILVQQHREVDALLEQMTATEDTDTDQRAELFEMVRAKLLSHARAEEKTFYPALKKAGEKKDAKHAEHEHREIEDAVKELSACECDDDEWSEQAGKLAKTVRHHVKEEESNVFGAARESMETAELDQLAGEFLAAQKQELIALGAEDAVDGDDTDDNYEELTKQELLEEARDRDIQGRASMSKDELITQLRGNAT